MNDGDKDTLIFVILGLFMLIVFGIAAACGTHTG